ncbi:MAG: DUF72 domain-containing protein [Candidatus Bathyarchaeota archaeon]|nr:DUF72 domain-containing protein [Candidatus Bathyarchaeota archaeon]
MTEYFLGCSGFYYNHWKGTFYLPNQPKTHWLPYYSKIFNTLEVNSTFYRYPSEKMLKNWNQKTPENFRFTLKANRAITHSRKFKHSEQLTANFYKLAHLLGEKLLCILFQLPPFVHKNMTLLQTIISQLDTSVMNALEFRHQSWWDREVYDFMKSHNLVFCSVSASGLPDGLIKTADAVYVRFHGKDGWYQHNYPEEELEAWAGKIKQQNPAKVLCYFNNDFNANATRNCLTLKKILEPRSRSTPTPLPL